MDIEVDLKEIKTLELAEIDQAFLDGLGFANEAELREALREQMLQRVEYDVQQSMRDQINNYLLQNVYIDLPSKLSDRQADRVLSRRRIELLMRGLPEDQVDSRIEAIRGGIKEEAVRDLKLFFILQKIATDFSVDVDEAELNGTDRASGGAIGQEAGEIEAGDDGRWLAAEHVRADARAEGGGQDSGDIEGRRRGCGRDEGRETSKRR